MPPTKPRPRLRARQPPQSTTDSVSVKPERASSSVLEIEDEDAMFIRNKNRGAKDWIALNKAVTQVERTRTLSGEEGESSSESDAGYRSLPNKKNRFFQKNYSKKPPALPSWTKTTPKGKYVSSTLDDDSDGLEVLPQIISSPSHSTISEKTPDGKRKRSRSRSLSLTPPPAVTEADQKRNREIVAGALKDMSPTRPSKDAIIDLGEESDEIELSPEFVQLLAKAKKETTKPTHQAESGPSSHARVDLRIRILPHPDDETGRVEIFNYEMKRNDTFQGLFLEIADQIGTLQDRVVVMYSGKRVFPTSSPATLSIWSAAELEACSEHVYFYITAQKRASSLPPSTDYDGSAVTSLNHNNHSTNVPTTITEEETDRSDVFKLRLRAGDKELTVSVRPTTKCGSIVTTFVKRLGLDPKMAGKAHVDVDGEPMDADTEIGDAGLEDGDLVDIIGL